MKVLPVPCSLFPVPCSLFPDPVITQLTLILSRYLDLNFGSFGIVGKNLYIDTKSTVVGYGADQKLSVSYKNYPRT
ncbi:hypothetical protein [Gloeothece verrucosa]|uniref:hypothetical protein n=1 Tax=Gloeothece verrucosa TaxID=2546359 RepID=UPI0012FE9C45|nr:hypothetical protein [Gloeothece verrucosa]